MDLFQSSLKDKLFCAEEERDYFQGKYLEQVSQISALRTELDRTKTEVRRLRLELMNNTSLDSPPLCNDKSMDTISDISYDEEKKVDGGDDFDPNSELRENAAQLLQWADYRRRSSAVGSVEEDECSKEDEKVGSICSDENKNGQDEIDHDEPEEEEEESNLARQVTALALDKAAADGSDEQPTSEERTEEETL